MMRHLVRTLVIVSALVIAPAVLAQSAGQQTHALTHRLMSPYCPGLLLADCRSPGAADLRREILQRVEGGEDADAIERDLIARFGAAVRTEPEFSGVGLLAWLTPLPMGLAGFGLVVLVVRRATRGGGAESEGEREGLQSDADLRLQDELDAMD